MGSLKFILPVVLVAPASALAQDPATQLDAKDNRPLVRASEGVEIGWQVFGSLSGFGATNPDHDSDDASKVGLYLTPGIGGKYMSATSFGGEFQAKLLVDGDLYDSGSTDLNEARVELRIQASAPVGPGRALGDYRYINVYAPDRLDDTRLFGGSLPLRDAFSYDQKRYILGYEISVKRLKLRLEQELRASGQADQRRDITRVTGKLALPTATPLSLTLKAWQSDFHGANRGRNDLSTETTLESDEFKLFGLSNFSMSVTLYTNDSDAPGASYWDLQFGPTFYFGAGRTRKSTAR